MHPLAVQMARFALDKIPYGFAEVFGRTAGRNIQPIHRSIRLEGVSRLPGLLPWFTGRGFAILKANAAMVKQLDRFSDAAKTIDVGHKIFTRFRYGLERVSPAAMSWPFPQQLIKLNEGHRIA